MRLRSTTFADHSRAHLAPDSQTPPLRSLRIAVLLDGWEQPRWIRHALEQIAAQGLGDIVAVVLNGAAAPSRARRSVMARALSWVRNATYIPYELYRRLDERLYRFDPDPFDVSSVQALLRGAAVVQITPRQTALSDYFSDEDVERLLALRLDVALRVGFRILRGRALQIASSGVWSFHHGDNAESRGGPSCFWEVLEGRESTGAVLQVLSEDLDAGQLLARVEVPTHALSVSQTKGRLYWRAVPALLAALDRLRSGDASASQRNMLIGEWQAYSHPLYTRPRAGSMLRLAGRLVARRLRARWQSFHGREQWRLMLHLDRGSQSDVPNAAPFRFRHLIPPADRYWADPCPVWHDARHWVFFEDHPFASANAHISVVELNNKGEPVSEPVVALRRDYHVSYPFLFQWNGTWYLAPESYTRGAIELYRCVRFPDSWEFAGNLLEGVAAVDPTIVRIGDHWWLFAASMCEMSVAADVLFLFFADSPLGPWTPHPLNPVKVDLHSARPAGRPFEVGGTWYRPAQDGSPSYGTRILFNRIDEISPTAFRETAVGRLTPTWDRHVIGTHTINCARGLTAIDARYPTNARRNRR
jgi:methionyl-tRNA formyltransferase